MVLKKIIFQNRYVALETPPPFMANAILNFHFDYWHPSLSWFHSCLNLLSEGMKDRILRHQLSMGFLIRRSAKLLHTFFLNFDLDFYDQR